MVSAAVSLLSDFFLIKDLTDENAKYGSLELMTDAKWTTLSMAFIAIAAVVGVIIALISRGRAFKITSAAISAVAFVMSIVFLHIIRKDALYIGGNGYASGVGYFAEMLQVAIPSLIVCAYCIFASIMPNCDCVTADKTQKVSADEVTGGEQNEEI